MPPRDRLLAYRLGSHGATVELQPEDAPRIHVDFDAMRLARDAPLLHGRAVILTGTAGDGKTYLAYRILDALGIERTEVERAQRSGSFDADGVFIDLDLSAGVLTDARVRRLGEALARPEALSLVCANEGKLAELEARLAQAGMAVAPDVLRVNLSRRAIASSAAWHRVLEGVLHSALWAGGVADDPLLAWNRDWLGDAEVVERLRAYLLLPYLLGEPITVREVLSFLAYALGGGIGSDRAQALLPEETVRYRLFNAVFSEPDGFVHGGRAQPTEKLLWWLYRFDPADQASPKVDLDLLIHLDRLSAEPPPDLLAMWRQDLVVRSGEKSDSAYRRRLDRFMRYARRWYSLASDDGFRAYFPFRHFAGFVRSLSDVQAHSAATVADLLRGLNRILSRGRVEDDDCLRLYYLATASTGRQLAISRGDRVLDDTDLALVRDLDLDREVGTAGDAYLEQLPRRLYLVHREHPALRLPVSLVLYEVLASAGGAGGGFAATLWARESDAVRRFLGTLHAVSGAHSPKSTFVVHSDAVGSDLTLEFRQDRGSLKVR